jgi:phytoene synthase
MPFATDADRAVCHDMIKAGSKTFAAASLLMPSDVREAAYAVYAFCRLSDDMVDVEGGSADAIGRLRQRLDWAYAGRPAAASVDRAFADVIAAFNLPRALPEALIDGLEWDVVGVTCDSLDDLYAYAVRVAGSVGAMMSVLMAARDPDTVARACDLGVAMQLTNIARDVGEDARAGRLYLPRSWLRADGLDPEAWLARPEFCPPVGAAIERLLRAADKLYARADAGIRKLPMNCRPAIFAARHLYREIGIEVSRRGFDSISGRARVSRIRKFCLIGRAVLDAARPGSLPANEAPLDQAAYLVEAVAAAPGQSVRQFESPTGRVSDRIVWVAELFAALGERERRTSGAEAWNSDG